MQRESRAYLWDVDRAAVAIERFVSGLDLQTYEQSEIVHSAVERKPLSNAPAYCGSRTKRCLRFAPPSQP
jgi:hypothetical protein